MAKRKRAPRKNPELLKRLDDRFPESVRGSDGIQEALVSGVRANQNEAFEKARALDSMK